MFALHSKAVRCALMAAVFCGSVAVTRPAAAVFVVTTAAGDSTPASIQLAVDSFRAAIGDPNNGNAPGPLASGRREINWDGGGAVVATPVGTPMTTFQNNRGATFTTPGTGFLQTPLGAPELAALNANYATTFSTFSPVRFFTPVESNITDATFSVPGTAGAVPATVSGFGAVFSDVDLADTTQIEAFDILGNSLTTAFAPAATVSSGGLSFVGIFGAAGEQIARVRITTGNSALKPDDQNGNPVDVVVMDDFIFGEPLIVPEPSSLALAACGFAGALFGWLRRKRKAVDCRP